MRHASRNGSDLRVVLDLTQSIKPRSFVLPANQQYGHRLVIDLYPQNQQQAKSVSVVKDKASERRDVVVVIDAGHGGDDPGASGPYGIREKKRGAGDCQGAANSVCQAIRLHAKNDPLR